MRLMCAFMRGFTDGLLAATVEGYGYSDEAAREVADFGLSLGSAIEQKVSTTITRARAWTDSGAASCTHIEI